MTSASGPSREGREPKAKSHSYTSFGLSGEWRTGTRQKRSHQPDHILRLRSRCKSAYVDGLAPRQSVDVAAKGLCTKVSIVLNGRQLNLPIQHREAAGTALG